MTIEHRPAENNATVVVCTHCPYRGEKIKEQQSVGKHVQNDCEKV